MPASLSVEPFSHSRGVGYAVSGEMDLATASILESHLDFSAGPESVVVDLSGVSFMDSTGLRSVVKAHEDAQVAGTTLAIVTNDNVQRLLALTGLADRLNVYPSREAAIADG